MCAELGFSRWTATLVGSVAGKAATVAPPACSGDESSLSACGSFDTTSATCDEQRAPLVSCGAFSLAMLNGTSGRAGLLRMPHMYPSWVTSSGHEAQRPVVQAEWTTGVASGALAAVVCRSIGAASEGALAVRARFDHAPSMQYASALTCGGVESDISDCNGYYLHQYGYGSEVTGAVCRTGELSQSREARFPSVSLLRRSKCGSLTPRTTSKGAWKSSAAGRGGGTDWAPACVPNALVATHAFLSRSVCADSFGVNEAKAVCREMGFVDAAASLSFAVPAASARAVWLTSVQCGPEATSLTECAHDPYQSRTTTACVDGRIAAVVCQRRRLALLDPTTLRETTASQGVLAFWTGERFAPVQHSSDFGNDEMRLAICRDLGVPDSPAVIQRGSSLSTCGYLAVESSIVCSGAQLSPSSCTGIRLSMSCTRDVMPVLASCPRVRIVGPSSSEGDVFVMHDGQWKGVCDAGFTSADASVVCREAGFTGDAQATSGSFFGGRALAGYALRAPGCAGAETALQSCPNGQLDGAETCSFSKARVAGVRCDSQNHGIRLVSAAGSELDVGATQGFLQTLSAGAFNWVRAESVTVAHARVLCRSLGLPVDSAAAMPWTLPSVCGSSVNLKARCTGLEQSMESCIRTGEPSEYGGNCGSLTVVWLQCPRVRLHFDPQDPHAGSRGRLQVWSPSGSAWEGVCKSDSWSPVNAEVVCRELGYPGALAGGQPEYAAAARLAPEFICSGSEQRLVDCAAHAISTCLSRRSVGVHCQPRGASRCRVPGHAICHADHGAACSPTLWRQRPRSGICRNLPSWRRLARGGRVGSAGLLAGPAACAHDLLSGRTTSGSCQADPHQHVAVAALHEAPAVD